MSYPDNVFHLIDSWIHEVHESEVPIVPEFFDAERILESQSLILGAEVRVDELAPCRNVSDHGHLIPRLRCNDLIDGDDELSDLHLLDRFQIFDHVFGVLQLIILNRSGQV